MNGSSNSDDFKSWFGMTEVTKIMDMWLLWNITNI